MYLFRFFPSATACDLASPITDQYVYVTNGCINQGNNSYAIYSCAGSNYTTKFYSNSACTKFVKTTTTPITPGCVDNTGSVDNNQQLAQIMTCKAAPVATGYLKTTYFSDTVCGAVSNQVSSSVGICLQNLNVTNGAVLSSFSSTFTSTGNNFKLAQITYSDGQCTQNPSQTAVVPGVLNTCSVYGPTSSSSFYSASPVVPELYSGGLELT